MIPNLITLQHVRINGESCVSIEQDGELVWILDLSRAKYLRERDLLLTAFLRTL